jgi:hypothetical protein
VYDNLVFGSIRATAYFYDDDSRLQQLLCYDDDNDNMVDPGSSNAIGDPEYMFLSLIFIYVLFFLSVLYDSFLYACSEIVLFIMIYMYVCHV